ncbi:MAG: tetratricopeptide repeat protein [Acidobacteriota bacterium]
MNPEFVGDQGTVSDRDDWWQVDRIFSRALTLTQRGRTAYLNRTCGDDAVLRRRVDELLAEDAALDECPGLSLLPCSETVLDDAAAEPTMVGPYRLLGLLGTGGMGTVYLAEQDEPVERRVALKLIRRGLGSEQVLARFEAERQAMALMDHSNVARVYDVGATEAGASYFAMEYVPGHAIHAHCDRLELDLRQRVELFLQVCDGVQHAHQKGLIHRDLKPSNILVKTESRQRARVKIIDFGVAKSLQRKLCAHSNHTQVGTFVGTPVYSSPEQIRGRLSADTRSDLYSLGVVLYELLVGVPPHSNEELDGKSPHELTSILETREPPTPHLRFETLEDDRAAVAQRRSLTVDSMQRQLRGDLSWIVLKCLERSPEDRYASVSELRKDLERWLADKPVEARPPTRLYRLGKLIRRHRTAVLLAAAALLALWLTTTAAVLGFVRAEAALVTARRAALEAERAASFQDEQLQAVDPASMGALLRAELLRTVGERWSERFEPDAVLARQEELVSLLEGVSFTDLALALLERSFLERARAVIEERHGDTPQLQARLRQSLAESLGALGLWDEALEMQELALEQRRALLGAEHPRTLESLRGRGRLRLGMGRLDEAEADLAAAVAISRRVRGAGHPDTARAQLLVGELFYHRAAYAEGEAVTRRAVATLREALGDEDPATLGAINNLAVFLVAQRRLDEATALHREAMEGRRRVLGPDHPETLESIGNTALLLMETGDVDEAEEQLREVLRTKRRVLGTGHPKTLRSMSILGVFLQRQGLPDEAAEFLEEVYSTRRRVLGPEHRETLKSAVDWASVAEDLGRRAEAELQYRQVVTTIRQVLGEEHLDFLYAQSDLAGSLRAWERAEEALALEREILRIGRRAHRDTHHLATWLVGHGQTLAALGRVDEADDVLDEALGLFAAAGPIARGAHAEGVALRDALELQRAQQEDGP